jgi:hypothetical protein
VDEADADLLGGIVGVLDHAPMEGVVGVTENRDGREAWPDLQ